MVLGSGARRSDVPVVAIEAFQGRLPPLPTTGPGASELFGRTFSVLDPRPELRTQRSEIGLNVTCTLD